MKTFLGYRLSLWLIMLAMLAVSGIGALISVDYYARAQVCYVVSGSGSLKPPPGKQMSEEAAERAIEVFRLHGRLVLFNRDLRKATAEMADDLDELLTVLTSVQGKTESQTWEAFPALMSIAGSADTHARQMQRECGIAVVGMGK